jgi:hypothetical protein
MELTKIHFVYLECTKPHTMIKFITYLSLIFLFSLSLSGCDQLNQSSMDANAIIENNEKRVQNLDDFVTAWNTHDASTIQNQLSEDFQRWHCGTLQANSLEEMRALMNASFARNDAKVELVDVHYHGDKAYVAWVYSGMNIGAQEDSLPATHKPFTSMGFTVATFDTEGKINKTEVFADNLAVNKQLGYTMALIAPKKEE